MPKHDVKLLMENGRFLPSSEVAVYLPAEISAQRGWGEAKAKRRADRKSYGYGRKNRIATSGPPQSKRAPATVNCQSGFDFGKPRSF